MTAEGIVLIHADTVVSQSAYCERHLCGSALRLNGVWTLGYCLRKAIPQPRKLRLVAILVALLLHAVGRGTSRLSRTPLWDRLQFWDILEFAQQFILSHQRRHELSDRFTAVIGR